MTESTPPLPPEPGADPLDDAASAAVDGLPLDADGRSIDPARLAERVAELSAVTALLAEPMPSPAPSIIDAHVSAALAALESDAPSETEPAGPAVVPLADRRRRPSATRWLAVAAAIAVVALAIPVVQSLADGSSSSNDTATSAGSGDTDPQSSDAQGESRTLDNGDLASPQTSSTAPPMETSPATKQAEAGGDLGTAESPEQLAAMVQVAAPDATGQSTTQTTVTTDAFSASTTTANPLVRSTTPTCDAATRATHPELGALRYSATATLRSVPVEVAIYEVPDPSTITYRLIVTAVTDCRVLVDQIYP